MGYAAAAWQGFGATVAALAGALTGLLFVALSIQGSALAKSRSLRSRAAQTLVLFMTSGITAILLTAPQPRRALGAELVACALFFGTVLFILDLRGGHDPESKVAQYIERASPNTVTAALIGIAGVSFGLKGGGGLYWLIPAVVVSLIGGVVNAWLFLVAVETKEE